MPALVAVTAHGPFELAAPGCGADLQEDVVDRRGEDHASAGLGQGGDRGGDPLENVHAGVHELGGGAPSIALGGPTGERGAHILL